MKLNARVFAAFGAVALFATATPGFAAQITISGHGDYRQGSGGEFNVVAADAAGAALLGSAMSRGYVVVNGTVVGTANGTAMNTAPAAGLGLVGFETFCIEMGQTITLPGTYDASISAGAKPGGTGGNGIIDYVSIGTAYLYYNFAKGTLAGYTYTNGPSPLRAKSAEALQQAIWFLEDELTLSVAQTNANIFLNGSAAGALQVYGANAKNNNNNAFRVGALNLGAAPGFGKQDQLILTVPDGGSVAMLLGLALGAVSLARRKMGR